MSLFLSLSQIQALGLYDEVLAQLDLTIRAEAPGKIFVHVLEADCTCTMPKLSVKADCRNPLLLRKTTRTFLAYTIHFDESQSTESCHQQ